MWTRDICKQIEENLTEITKELNARLRDDLGSDDIRLGIVGYKLYVRLRNTNPYVWENLYSKENFHFKSLEDKRKLVDDACSHMAIKAETQFSQLVGQLTDYDKTVDDRRPNADLHPYKSQLKGETLHLISDILGTPFAERQDLIDHIGRGKRGWGVIRNPNLRADPERVISTLVGIVMSDGHVDPNCHVTYTDAYPDRLARVREAVSMLGDVDVSEKVNAVSGSRYIHIPAVVGRLLVKTGMVTGDKTIQDERLPEVVRTAPLEAVAGYVRELTADDGSFAVDKTSGEFQWNRSIVLHAGNKTEAYGHKQAISDEEVDYIKTHGEMKTMSFGGAKDTIVHILKVTELKELHESPDPETASIAKRLLKTVESNPPRLMEDERQLCEDLGIRTREYALVVRLFDESGRVSVSWQAQTSTNDDAMVWGLVAPPNDARKSEKVSEWVSERIKLLISKNSRSS